MFNKKHLSILALGAAIAMPSLASADYWAEESLASSRGNNIALDTEDPLYLTKLGDFLFKTSASMSNRGRFLAGEDVMIGLNDRLALTLDIAYQNNFDGPQDGFSGPGFGLVFRSGQSMVTTDIYAGLQLAGNHRVPEFASNTWYGGVRMGRQWSWVTLSAALQTSWIFDDTYGHAYIDFMPEAYFRIGWNFSAGVGADLRKSTGPEWDREWVNFRIAQRYGNTMYVAFTDYEFEMDEWRFGLRLNLLF